MTTEIRWDADDYARNSGIQAGWAEELIGKLPLKGDEHVLDIGCGDGGTTSRPAAHVLTGRVVGIDSSPEMIARARAGYFDGFPFPYGFYDVEEYLPWLTAAGLVALRVELIPKKTVHPSREAFEGWIRTTWLPYTQHLPENRRPAFVSALAGAYLARHPADDAGRCRVRMARLEVEARRG